MKLKELRERRAAKATELKTLHENSANQEWTADMQSRYDELMGEVVNLDTTIRRTEEVDRVNESQTVPTRDKAPELTDDRRNETESDPARVALDRYIRNGAAGFTEQEWAKLRSQMAQNTMSTGTPAEGGYTVQTEVAAQVIEAMKAFGGMRAVSGGQSTSRGNPFQWPTTDGTAEVGELIAENVTATGADISFGVKTIGAYKYSSKIITVPFELLQDSEVDVEALVRARIDQRLARIENQHFTTGAGTTEPEGVVTASTLGVTANSATVPTLDEIVELMHAVDPAYRAGSRFMMHDSMLETLRKLKDDYGRPQFWAASNNLADALPMTLLGYPITINQDMPAPTTGLKAMLFGDFSKYFIRDVMSITLFRFTDSKYSEKGQVGFLAWMRADGKYTDVGASMKHMIMA